MNGHTAGLRAFRLGRARKPMLPLPQSEQSKKDTKCRRAETRRELRRTNVKSSQGNLRRTLSAAGWGKLNAALLPIAVMKEPRSVLLVEDQRDIAANIWDFLERRGYHVDHAFDGEAGMAAALRGNFDVIVLDLGLPRLDGLELCRRLRETDQRTPVLMLTARDTLDDKLRGFAEGADDYLVKPFAMRELEARIRAVYRRCQPSTDAPLVVGDLRYDPKTLRATRRGHSIELTRAQSAILHQLMLHSPQVLTHQSLIVAVWGDVGGDATVAALHTHVYELRKLVDRPFGEALILSVRGVGYRMEKDRWHDG